MALFSELDNVESTISELSDPERGLILVTAHVGPLFAGPLAIELMGLKAKWLASTPSLGAMVFVLVNIFSRQAGPRAVASQGRVDRAEFVDQSTVYRPLGNLVS